MIKTTAKLLLAYFVVDAAVLVLSLMQGNDWLLNTQAAFACSLLITVASFYSYHRMVQSRLAAGMIPPDKFDRYYEDDEDESDQENKDVTQDNPPESEKKPPKIGFKESFQNLSLSYKSALSVYRIATYGILFLTLSVLVHNNRFDAVAFLLGLSVIPLCGLFGAVFLKKDFYGTYES